MTLTPTGASAPGPDPIDALLARLATDRGLDFEPVPGIVAAELPALGRTVDQIMARLVEPQEQRWFAAALAAWSHHVQAASLTEPARNCRAGRATVGGMSCRCRVRPWRRARREPR
jgi:hypothetical protein